MNNKRSLGDRMKQNYENRYRFYLTRRTPAILRLDGKAFHTFAKRWKKPFDSDFCYLMDCVAKELVENIQGSVLAYTQSDEISILITDYKRFSTDAWFDYNIQKMVSISAGMASAIFTKALDFPNWGYTTESKLVVFDCRAFNVPRDDVNNYFIWRQQDWVKNSVQMLARSHFSHKELKNKNIQDMHEMLYTKGINWTHLDSRFKNGSTFFQENDNNMWETEFIFSKNHELIQNLLKPIEE